MANPDPEIDPRVVPGVRDDVIIATGRSDYANQVNNVLCFPFIFRGALDARASEINMPMKMACVRALQELAKEPVPNEVLAAYSTDHMEFGSDYILPKPVDPRLREYVAPKVIEAARDSGAVGE
jgi:malate dehydrogenase (oxaloacetate-decarboxylating)(NADP+)